MATNSDDPGGNDSGGGPPPRPESLADRAPPSVGVAEMLADGTLHLMLRAVTDDGSIGEALMIVPPDDPRHADLVAHLGGIAPGGSCEIPPFTQQ